MRRRIAVLPAVIALILLATGCAIPTQQSPSTIAPTKVPFHLLDPHVPTTTTTQPKPSSYVEVKVFLLNSSNQPTAVQRLVAAPAPLDAIISAMLVGPSSADPPGTTTAIPSDVRVLSVTQQGSVVTVNMSSAFGQITGINSELSVAQIVATIANENGLGTGVIFEIDGQRTSVPIANGSLVTGPVYLIEFLSGAP